MSQVSGENVQNVQNVRERVLQLAREIEGMSREAVPPETFFQEFINRVVAAVGAPAGAVWMRNGSNRLSLVAGARLDQIGFPSNRQSLISNEKLLAEVVSTGEACTRSPHDETDVELPTEHLLVFSALHRGKDCVGVVQLFQRPDAPNEARPGYLQFLEQMCGYASRYLEGKHVGEDEPEVAGRFWTDFEQFVLRMQRSLDSQEIAATAASDGRLVLGCDRLSVAVRRGRRTSIRAVSGQTAVNPRANLIRAMVVLCRKVMAMGEPLLYTGKIDDIAPQIEKPLANFVQESTSRMVKLVPMFEPEPLVRGETDDETRRRSKTRCRRPIGCLVAEQVSESEPARQLEERLEMIADHVAASLTNAQRHERIFLLPLWKSVGRTLEWFHGRRLAAAVAVLLLLAAGISALILVPWDYRVTAKGKLMPVRQVAIFAPRTAQVLPPEIEGGERVTSGQVLLHMKDEELDEKINDAENGVLQHENNLTALYARLRKLLNPTENRIRRNRTGTKASNSRPNTIKQAWNSRRRARSWRSFTIVRRNLSFVPQLTALWRTFRSSNCLTTESSRPASCCFTLWRTRRTGIWNCRLKRNAWDTSSGRGVAWNRTMVRPHCRWSTCWSPNWMRHSKDHSARSPRSPNRIRNWATWSRRS